jgi:ATP-dependent protease HslVU (ClpYQ) peptidase subunit
MRTRVSGVPYEVELVDQYVELLDEKIKRGDMIAELERENFMMRARMDRLEDELRTANELLTKAHIDLLNERRRARYYEEND